MLLVSFYHPRERSSPRFFPRLRSRGSLVNIFNEKKHASRSRLKRGFFQRIDDRDNEGSGFFSFRLKEKNRWKNNGESNGLPKFRPPLGFLIVCFAAILDGDWEEAIGQRTSGWRKSGAERVWRGKGENVVRAFVYLWRVPFRLFRVICFVSLSLSLDLSIFNARTTLEHFDLSHVKFIIFPPPPHLSFFPRTRGWKRGVETIFKRWYYYYSSSESFRRFFFFFFFYFSTITTRVFINRADAITRIWILITDKLRYFSLFSPIFH